MDGLRRCRRRPFRRGDGLNALLEFVGISNQTIRQPLRGIWAVNFLKRQLFSKTKVASNTLNNTTVAFRQTVLREWRDTCSLHEAAMRFFYRGVIRKNQRNEIDGIYRLRISNRHAMSH